MDSRPRPEHTRLDYSDAGPGDATEPGSKLLRSNQQSRVSCFARSADFRLGQQVAAESPAIVFGRVRYRGCDCGRDHTDLM